MTLFPPLPVIRKPRIRWYHRLLCAIFGHKYEVWQVFSPEARRVVCLRCRDSWGMHDGVRALVPWDGIFAALYESRNDPIRPFYPWEEHGH